MPASQYNPAFVGTHSSDSLVKKGKQKMTKLTRLFGVCVLVVSLSAVALAEGSVTQGPPAPVPPPPAECVNEGTDTLTSTSQSQDPSVDFGNAAQTLASWLIASIL
jgi:hypothetical protein